MSQRFYLDLTNGPSTIRDEKGIWTSDLNAAIVSARDLIEEMRDSDELSEGEEGWLLVIRDPAGEALMTLPVVPRTPTPKHVS